MKAFIYIGGHIYPENITEHPEKEDLVIAADSGYKNAISLGVSPSVLIGDFDSIDKANLEKAKEELEIIKLPAEKNYTDTQIAVDEALRRGATQLTVIGGLSGRLDHTLSTVAILKDLWAKKVYCVITSGKNRVRYINASSTLISRSGYKYLSLIADGKKVKGVTAEGCKYPLSNATLTDSMQYAVSNEITLNCAFISVKKGGLFVIESLD